MDVRKLASKYTVNFIKGIKELVVNFAGPIGTPYEHGIWVIRIDIPDSYPFQSPSVGFINKIYHPNVDEASGSVCLDVINQKWSSIYELTHIFDHFLPQLLQEPNVGDPLNQTAAQHLSKDPGSFQRTVLEYVEKYATVLEVLRLVKLTCPEFEEEDEMRTKLNHVILTRKSPTTTPTTPTPSSLMSAESMINDNDELNLETSNMFLNNESMQTMNNNSSINLQSSSSLSFGNSEHELNEPRPLHGATDPCDCPVDTALLDMALLGELSSQAATGGSDATKDGDESSLSELDPGETGGTNN